MVVVTEVRHPRSLDFANERRLVIKRDQGHKWKDIKKVLKRGRVTWIECKFLEALVLSESQHPDAHSQATTQIDDADYTRNCHNRQAV